MRSALKEIHPNQQQVLQPKADNEKQNIRTLPKKSLQFKPEVARSDDDSLRLKMALVIIQSQQRKIQSLTTRLYYLQWFNQYKKATEVKGKSEKSEVYTPKKRRMIDDTGDNDADSTCLKSPNLATPNRNQKAIRPTSTMRFVSPTAKQATDSQKTPDLKKSSELNNNNFLRTSLADKLKEMEDKLEHLDLKNEDDKENIPIPTAQSTGKSGLPTYNSSNSQKPPTETQTPKLHTESTTAPATATPAATSAAKPVGGIDTASRGVPHTPVLAAHDTLHEAVQKAKISSIKTLFKEVYKQGKNKEVAQARDLYQFNSEKYEYFSPNKVQELPIDKLENSIYHYHHGISIISPLSPLGEQSSRDAKAPPVPLTELSMLQEKLVSWRGKYSNSTNPVVTPSP